MAVAGLAWQPVPLSSQIIVFNLVIIGASTDFGLPQFARTAKKRPGRKILYFRWSGAASAVPLQFLTGSLVVVKVDVAVD